jgi:hypothetical protein
VHSCATATTTAACAAAACWKRGVKVPAIATLVFTSSTTPPWSRGNSHGPAQAAAPRSMTQSVTDAAIADAIRELEFYEDEEYRAVLHLVREILDLDAGSVVY